MCLPKIGVFIILPISPFVKRYLGEIGEKGDLGEMRESWFLRTNIKKRVRN